MTLQAAPRFEPMAFSESRNYARLKKILPQVVKSEARSEATSLFSAAIARRELITGKTLTEEFTGLGRGHRARILMYLWADVGRHAFYPKVAKKHRTDSGFGLSAICDHLESLSGQTSLRA